MRIGILGGGAAGFFAAIQIASAERLSFDSSGGERVKNSIHIIERTSHLLSKVRISGGGRCNVTHNLPDNKEFSGRYPRGEKELFHAFRKFNSLDMRAWFEEQNVLLKSEKDGRMFPVTDSSETIIGCFLELVKNYGIIVHTSIPVKGIRPMDTGTFTLDIDKITNQKPGIPQEYDKLIVATGSNRQVWKWLEAMGHRIVSPVPSLFTFQITDPRLKDLSGLSFPDVKIRLLGSKLETQGPLLITHWGLSGPVVLRLSAWGAVELYNANYRLEISINFIGCKPQEAMELIQDWKTVLSKKNLSTNPYPDMIPNRYWERILSIGKIPGDKKWAHLTKEEMRMISQEISDARFQVEGKGEFKDEFVTAGGVNRKDINFETMESKVVPGLYFAGEVVDVDGITGGFNFQNAWTTAWIASRGILGIR